VEETDIHWLEAILLSPTIMVKVEAAPSPDKSSKNRPVEKEDKTFQKMQRAILISATTWDIYSPPPSNSFSVSAAWL
jgi:hypothetical protein